MSAKQRRQGLKLSVKNAFDSIEVLRQQDSAEAQAKLQRKGVLLQSYLDRIEPLDTEILSSITVDEELEKELESIRTFNDTLLEAIIDTQPLAPGQPQSPGVGPSFSGNRSNDSSRVKLPKLELPPFEGNPIQWQEFWDAFKAAIHTRSDLKPVDKLTYLRGLLKGEAFHLVEGFRVTEVNYDSVVDVLTKRYGDKQAVIFAHVDAVLTLPAATGEAASLFEMHSTLERHLRSLDSLEPDQGTILYSIVMSKLPRFLKIEANRKRGTRTDWTLSNLREWLQEEIRARELGDRLHNMKTGEHKDTVCTNKKAPFAFKSSRLDSRGRRNPTSASVLVTHSRKGQCPFCSSAHGAEQCFRFPDTESRRAQLSDRCFSCLNRGHSAKDCRSRRPCRYCQRTGHHCSLCFTQFGRLKDHTPQTSARGRVASSLSRNDREEARGVPVVNTTAQSVQFSATEEGHFTPAERSERTVMQTAIVHLVNKPHCPSVRARILFDTGASRSFITVAKQTELQLPIIQKEYLSISSFQSSKRSTMEYKLVDLGVQCRDGSVQQVVAAVVPTITCPIQKVPLAHHKLAVPEWALAEPIASSPEFVVIDVLIGMDYYHSFISSHKMHAGNNLWFLSSKVGYITSGRVPTEESGPETVAVMLLRTLTTPDTVESPVMDISKYWDLEEIGMKEEQDKGSFDEEALTSFSSTVKFENGRYQVCWPWKMADKELGNNFGLAFGRLKSLLNRLSKLPQLRTAYDSTFKDQLEQGVIEKAMDSSTRRINYYMPHHGVFKPDSSTTKLRVVFDASSKVNPQTASLNECLHRGPLFLENLCGLLLRFRIHAVAVVSDIEKAFLQIGLQNHQRDVTRFLWVKDPSKRLDDGNLVVYRFCRVPFGVISSPFLLAATVTHHLKQQGTRRALRILRDIYVDNIVTGEMSPSEALNYYEEAKRMFQNASMNLREFYSNSSTLLEKIPPEDRGGQAEPKVLGLRWNTANDTLRFSRIRNTVGNGSVTKRSIVKALPQVFDPCGLLAPVVLRGKLLVQDLWIKNLQWDEEVPEDIRIHWCNSVLPSLLSLSEVIVPRYVGDIESTNLQLHAFCDASKRASAVAVYLRRERDNSDTDVDLLMAKTRLAPIKQPVTIPRMELIAAVLGVRLLSFVRKQLPLTINEVFLWTDSQCVLHWIRSDQVATRFVENRVKEIRKFSDIHFRYVPSEQNPADLPSRGCNTETLMNTSTWWKGVTWLSLPANNWPMQPSNFRNPPLDVAQPESIVLHHDREKVERVIDDKRYSSIERLLRITAYVHRFLHNLRKAPAERHVGHLLLKEISRAKKLWIQIVQRDHFPDLIANIRASAPNSRSRQFGAFLDDHGLLRCSGRIDHAKLPYNTRFPVLLPKGDNFTNLLIMSYHRLASHSGTACTLGNLRLHFWIPQGRSVVKRLLHACNLCRRYEGGHFRAPPSPPLPSFRLEEAPPFTYTGLDYLGPLLIRNDTDSASKVWICLFTCAATRAIHLELLQSMTAEQFMLALRRFAAIYGNPRMLVSDNAKQFKSASDVLKKVWTILQSSTDFQSFTLSQQIEWRFIPEMAPWMGGFCERLVGIVKSALKKCLHSRQVTFLELQTVVSEISSVINSRPLTYVEDDHQSVPISPMQLISPMRRNDGPLMATAVSDPDYSLGSRNLTSHLLVRWRHLHGIVTDFWKSWQSQYLVGLRERQSFVKQRGVSNWPPTVGTVVIIKESLPRASWRFGRIQYLHKSNDGQVRSVSVRLAKGSLLRRPLNLVYPLEADVNDQPHNHDSSSLTTERPPMGRPQRAAARRARETWQHRQPSDESD